MKHFIKICMLTGLTLLMSTNLLAGTYKWTDEKGNVHYSQRPPPGTEYEKMKIDKPPQPGTTTPTPSSSPSSSGASSSADDAGSKAVADEVAKNEAFLKKNCAAAKNNLNVYQVHSRIKGTDGKIRVITQKEREEKIQAAKDAIREYCK